GNKPTDHRGSVARAERLRCGSLCDTRTRCNLGKALTLDGQLGDSRVQRRPPRSDVDRTCKPRNQDVCVLRRWTPENRPSIDTSKPVTTGVATETASC